MRSASTAVRRSLAGAPSPESLSRRVLARVASLADRLVLTIQESNPGYRGSRIGARRRPVAVLPRQPRPGPPAASAAPRPASGQEYVRRGPGHRPAARRAGPAARRRAPLVPDGRPAGLGGPGRARPGRADSTTTALLDVGTRRVGGRGRDLRPGGRGLPRRRAAAVRADEQRARSSLGGPAHRGRAEEPGFAFEAARILDVPVDGRYVVVVAEPRPATPTPYGGSRDRLAGGPRRVRLAGARRGAGRPGAGRRRRPRTASWPRCATVLEVRAGASSAVDGLGRGTRRLPAGGARAAHARPGRHGSPRSTTGCPRRCCCSRRSWPGSWSRSGSARCWRCRRPSAARCWRR